MADESTNAELEGDNATSPEAGSDEASTEQSEAVENVEVVGSAEVETIESLKAQIADLEAKLVGQSEDVLRAQAEMQNVRRRTENEISNARKFALERFVGDLLPVVDSLERGLDAVPSEEVEGEQAKALREGASLTLKMLLEVLEKFNVQRLDPEGEPFDPQFHEAMSMLENADAEPNSVLSVLQKGYTLNGRLVRAAMVVVSKAPA
ncbi:MAG: nucleotide exchange factor GrpE [Gammaproteobacteria bacterium]|nr:MAG: nucleotide exchange factor GrpE [Gammaproteobacteria bacterium]